MPLRAAAPRDWILVTGQPGCGKTTAVQLLYQALQQAGLPVRGFITQEVRESNSSRTGFDIVTVPDGQRARLARKEGLPKKWPRTGAYLVDVASLDRVAVPTLRKDDDRNRNNNHKEDTTTSASTTTVSDSRREGHDSSPNNVIYVLDEIGRMELHSKSFQEAVQGLLAQPAVRLVGAVTAPRYGHRVPFGDYVTAHAGVQVHHLTQKTREQVTLDLLDYIQTNWIDNTDGDDETESSQKRTKQTQSESTSENGKEL